MKALVLLLALATWVPASLLDNDPKVVYTREFAPKGIKLKVVKPMFVFTDKKASRKLARLKVGTQVELIGFNEQAYQIRGKQQNGQGVAGWVSPKALSSKNENFVEDFKKLYQRQLAVRELIENEEVAIGMTTAEVEKALGEPTKTHARQTAEGTRETWEFIIYEEVKHYANVRDPYTGGIYRRLVNVTREEKAKTKVEFEEGIAVALEASEDRSKRRSRVRSVSYPVYFAW